MVGAINLGTGNDSATFNNGSTFSGVSSFDGGDGTADTLTFASGFNNTTAQLIKWEDTE